MRKSTKAKTQTADDGESTILTSALPGGTVFDGEFLEEWKSPTNGAMVPVGGGLAHGFTLPPAIGKYPVLALTGGPVLFCNADWPAAILYTQIAVRLAEAGDVYRRPGRGEGLVVAPASPGEQPQEVTTGAQLGVVIKDRLPLVLVKGGKPSGSRLPAADLNDMVRTELFLNRFRTLDRVADRPEFYGDYRLTRPGFNDGGDGHRVYYPGPEPEVLHSRDAIDRFLDVMAFASDADRTNAVAAALTVVLRRYWPGGKPVILVTSTKSHGGKDTVLDFAKGETVSASVSYEPADWALQKAFVAAVKGDPRVGLVDVGNARTGDRVREIASAFLERFVTDPEPVLHAAGTGPDIRRPNHWVVAVTTNSGAVSKDIMNRALPVHLTPAGDVAGRVTKIGNPRYEYLPANRGRIAAELRGMVVRWKDAGSPPGKTVGHPMSGWARAVGGILEVHGYGDFLGNYPARLTADDPVRAALAVLGTELRAPDKWMAASYLAGAVAEFGLTGRLIPKDDRESPASRQRALAKVLDAHAAETFVADTGDGAVRLRLDRQRAAGGDGRVMTVYRFSDLGAVPVE